MREEDIYSTLFGFGSNTTFYTWKKDPKRIIFSLLEKYFTKEDLEEFLKSGKIEKFDFLDMLNVFVSQLENEIEAKLKKILKNLLDNYSYIDFEVAVVDAIFLIVHEHELKNNNTINNSSQLLKKIKELNDISYFSQNQILEALKKLDKIEDKFKVAYIAALGSLTKIEFEIWVKQNKIF